MFNLITWLKQARSHGRPARPVRPSPRRLGGDVMVSFGRAAGVELSPADTAPTVLQSAYQSVIDAYQLTHIDFDIEGAAVADHTSIDRRSQAIAGLEQAAAANGKE